MAAVLCRDSAAERHDWRVGPADDDEIAPRQPSVSESKGRYERVGLVAAGDGGAAACELRPRKFRQKR